MPPVPECRTDLLHAIPGGVLSFTDDGRISFANETLRAMLGYSAEEMDRRHIDTILSAGTRIFFQTHLFPLVKLHGSAEEIYLVLRAADGEDVAVLANVVRREEEGEPVSHCVFMRVRERKKFEEELLRAKKSAEEALRRNQELYEEAEKARAEADRANRAKSAFLATMSHEIRTPINAILGYTELLEMEVRGSLTAEQRSFVERARAGGEHLLTLITGILDLSKIESGGMTVRSEPSPLAEAVRESMEMIEAQAAASGVRIVEEGEGRELRYLGDADRTRQILINLLANAVKFTDEGGRVTVTWAASDSGGSHVGGVPREGSWMFVRVSDTGIGMAPEDLESIFEPFVQLDAGPTRKTGGTGLGLAISKRLAGLMGGDLVAESQPGRGSTFTLWLRAAEGEPAVEA